MNVAPAHQPAGVEARYAVPPAEVTVVHTRLLRCMLAASDCNDYWRRVDRTIPASERATRAFEERWFGTKTEARVRTIMTDMLERFDAFPTSLDLFQTLRSVPSQLRPWICHLHTQLADPLYRRFTGELLPTRRAEGFVGIDREAVARWVDALEPGRWSTATCVKFGSNLLATAFEAGLVQKRRDPRGITLPSVPGEVIGYALQLLRGVTFAGSLTRNPYVRSLIGEMPFEAVAPRVPGIRFASLGNVVDLSFDEPDLLAYGLAHLREGSAS